MENETLNEKGEFEAIMEKLIKEIVKEIESKPFIYVGEWRYKENFFELFHSPKEDQCYVKLNGSYIRLDKFKKFYDTYFSR